MDLIKKIWIITILVILPFLLSCTDDYDKIKLDIVGSGGTDCNFSGFYNVDAEGSVSLDPTKEGSIYNFEKRFKQKVDTLYINVTKVDYTAIITILIWKDDEIVETEILDAYAEESGTFNDNYKYTIEFTFENDDDDDDDDDDTTDTTS